MTFTHKLARRLAGFRRLALPLLVAAAACADEAGVSGPGAAPLSPATSLTTPVILVGAGNIARCDNSNDEATAKLLDAIPGTVFTTGDNVSASGSSSDFATCYGASWGRHAARTRPSAGDKDYLTTGAAGYFGYFGSAAGAPGQGYYSYDLGDWHIVALNYNVAMHAGSPQEQWLRADLAATTKRCTVAYWHKPRFSSYSTYLRDEVKPLWDALYAAGAEVVLNGHYRLYERFAPQTPEGVADPVNGIRQFTVGTGGIGTEPFGTPQPNSEVRKTGIYGVLELTLSTDTYSWRFVPVAGQTFAESGTGTCHGSAAAPSPAPAVVSAVEVTPGSTSVLATQAVQLAAVAKDSAGTILSSAPMTWLSGDTLVARVTATGLVTGIAAGATYVIATSNGHADTAALTVTSATPIACSPTGSGVCRYVDAVAGNDANPGTGSQPYRTLQKAGSVVNPGDVVVVRNGVYTGGSTILSLSRSGTAAAWIVVRAENKWGAVIDGQSNSAGIGIKISGSYIRVEGFEIFGTNHYGIEVYGGHDVQVARTHIHDVGRYCTSTSNGIVGINAYAANLLIEQNVVHDIGRLAHGEAGCTTTNNYWQNHDHGVYQGQGDNLIIRNNVFYNFTRGWAIQRYSGAGTAVTNLQIVNNTFVGANPYKDGQIIIASPVTGLVITNNIFMQPKTAGIYFSTSGVSGTVASNLTYGASLTTGTTIGLIVTGNRSGDPQFVNAGARNYRLQSGSPAIGTALVLGLVTNDFDGVLRPVGGTPDIGAFEYR